MAAGLGFKTFTVGEVLNAADTNGYLMQGVLVFADAVARDAAITAPAEGQFAYLKDTDVTTYYTSSAWANLDTTGMVNPMTTTADIIYSSSGSTPARLGIGSTSDVLTVAGGVPTWAAPAGAGGMTLLSTTTLSGASTTISSISQSYKDLICIFRGAATNGSAFSIRTNGVTSSDYYGEATTSDSATFQKVFRTAQTSMETKDAPNTSTNNTGYLKIYDYSGTSAAYKWCEFAYFDEPANRILGMEFVNKGIVSTGVTSITFLSAGSSSGTVLTYGVN